MIQVILDGGGTGALWYWPYIIMLSCAWRIIHHSHCRTAWVRDIAFGVYMYSYMYYTCTYLSM